MIEAALSKAGVSEEELSAVAVTVGPGLSMCLRVGVVAAQNICARHAKPIVPVHHMVGRRRRRAVNAACKSPVYIPSSTSSELKGCKVPVVLELVFCMFPLLIYIYIYKPTVRSIDLFRYVYRSHLVIYDIFASKA